MRKLRIEDKDIQTIVADTVSKLTSGVRNVVLNMETLLRIDAPKDKDKPIIHITAKAYNKIKHLVEESNKEIAWHGTVTQIDPMRYEITDVLVYPQLVTAATVESDDNGYTEWLDALDDDTFNTLRMQGHSHVNMGVTPSSVDTDFYDLKIKHIKDYYIFMIVNKSDKMWINLYDVANNLVYETTDVKLIIQGPDYKGWAMKEIEKFIKPLVAVTQYKGKDLKNPKALDVDDEESWKAYLKGVRGGRF